MSLLRWFRKSAVEAPKGPAGGESTRPSHLAGRESEGAGRRSERIARRAQLYGVVREAMVHAGVLSSGYKFKVLSLDSRGRQFLVMIDLGGPQSPTTQELAAIEATIVQGARSRHGILVKAVYWRANALLPAATGPRPSAAVAGASAAVAASVAAATAAGIARGPAAREPIAEDELAAFRDALAQGSAAPAARSFDGAPMHGPQSYTLLTGYEDTEVPDSPRTPALSPTQYGDLN